MSKCECRTYRVNMTDSCLLSSTVGRHEAPTCHCGIVTAHAAFDALVGFHSHVVLPARFIALNVLDFYAGAENMVSDLVHFSVQW